MTESPVENKKEFKDTLNLPKTTLEMRANATKKEPETQKSGKKIRFNEKIFNRN